VNINKPMNGNIFVAFNVPC